MDEDTCMVKARFAIMRFLPPTRAALVHSVPEGTTWLRKILTRFHEGGGTKERYPADWGHRERICWAGHFWSAGPMRPAMPDDFNRGEIPGDLRTI